MSKRCNKQNRVSALIKKKPSKCIYEKQGIKKNPQKRELLGIQATNNTFNAIISQIGGFSQ